jgi:hypothetical protein
MTTIQTKDGKSLAFRIDEPTSKDLAFIEKIAAELGVKASKSVLIRTAIMRYSCWLRTQILKKNPENMTSAEKEQFQKFIERERMEIIRGSGKISRGYSQEQED